MAKANGFVIEDGVPLPSLRKGRSEVIRKLKPGQSCLFQGVETSTLSAQGRVVAQRLGEARKFTVRKVEGGTRIWRVS